MEEEKEEDTEKLRIVFLLRRTQKYLFHQKVPAPPPQRLPLGRRSVGGCLSRWTLQETETFEEEGEEDLKPCFPFWRAESTSQLVFKLSLVKTISPVPLPQLSKEEGEGNFKQVWEASRLAFGRLFIILHKNPWTSGVFLTNNSRAMMHKRQHWSKFKILKVQNMSLSRSVCNWPLPLSDPPYSFPLLGGSTKQC